MKTSNGNLLTVVSAFVIAVFSSVGLWCMLSFTVPQYVDSPVKWLAKSRGTAVCIRCGSSEWSATNPTTIKCNKCKLEMYY